MLTDSWNSFPISK